MSRHDFKMSKLRMVMMISRSHWFYKKTSSFINSYDYTQEFLLYFSFKHSGIIGELNKNVLLYIVAVKNTFLVFIFGFGCW